MSGERNRPMDITYAMFGESGWQECVAEGFVGSVSGSDCCVFAEGFGGTVWHMCSAEETAEECFFNTHVNAST